MVTEGINIVHQGRSVVRCGPVTTSTTAAQSHNGIVYSCYCLWVDHTEISLPLPPLGHIWDVMLVWKRENIKKTVSVPCIVYYYNGAQRYEDFLQLSQLYLTCLILLSIIRAPLYLRSPWCYIYIINFFRLYLFLYLLVSWVWQDWPLLWLINCCPSVLWHCLLGHVTRKIVSKMTYNVSSGTLNPTIPYRITAQWKLSMHIVYG